ncbi:CrcB family protein [Kitasatospora sp. NBC_01287]|uniref:fluoride efflux transporter FluC n=1 Tax=Kitasatospora sp. NBC_01287 TaxID=2903573 RepID=UPI00224E4570|nr:CrcB family protein [Kitasatospora sp. NBC_01287]MCX4749229.1 CrcB family protein [Kitasatospora sp. NBC_01287]
MPRHPDAHPAEPGTAANRSGTSARSEAGEAIPDHLRGVGMRGERPPTTGGPPPAETLPVDPDTPSPPTTGQPARPRQWDVLAVIALGGGLGSVARYGLAHAWATPAGGFPWATFTTNIAGSLLLGLLMVYVLELWPPTRYVRPFLGVGVLGGFTTFSTYTVELRGLIATGHLSIADAYALTSLVAGLAAVWTGIVLARRLGHLPVRRGRAAAPKPGPPPPPSPTPPKP